jgi:hypothetical protein
MGPYEEPPFEEFRANPLIEIVQKLKIRPVLHMSSPKGQSFNAAIDMLTVDKLNMSSPKLLRKS